MSVKNNKSVAAQALLEMDSIVSAIKEESKKTLGGMLNEAVKNALRESVEEDDNEKDYEVLDDEKNDDAKDKKENGSRKKTSSSDVSEDENDELEGGMPQGGQQLETDPPQAMPQQAGAGAQDGVMQGADAQVSSQEAPMGGEGGLDAEAGAEGEGESGWDEFSDYKVGDDTYDLTGENDYENVVKIYKLLNDDDEVVVKKDGNKVQLKDNQAGTEYVIDLGGEGEAPEAAATEEPMGGEEEPSGLNEQDGFDIAGFPGDVEEDPEDFDGLSDGLGEFGDDEFHDDIDSLGDEDFDGDHDLDFTDDGLTDDTLASDALGDNNDLFENKRMKKPMKESKQVLFEVDLGYTDNYQDKDPIKGLSNNEPSKSGKSWHKGVPTGTQKPWAGPSKPKGDPFGEKTIEEGEEDCCPKCGKCGAECTCGKEVEEQKNVGGFVQQNSVTASNIPNSNGRKARSQRSASQGVEVTGSADPRYKSAANESKELKAIKAENRELKKAVLELRKNLNEAYITNVNLGKITKLFLENTTSKAEKVDIVNRFANEAKTVEQSKALFESISRELKKNGNANPMNLNESSQTAKGTKELNENAGYKSAEVLKTIDFMNRVLNC